MTGLILQLGYPNTARGLETIDVSPSVLELVTVVQLFDLDLSLEQSDPDPNATVKMRRPGSVSLVEGARCGNCLRGARGCERWVDMR